MAVVLPAGARTILPSNWAKEETNLVPDSWEVTDFIEGIAIDHITVISKELKFTIRHFHPFEKSWGSYDVSTGKATGFAKYLKEGKADLISAFYGYNTARFEVVDYAFPLSKYDYYFWIKKLKASDALQWNIFLSPFGDLVWIAIFSIGLCSAMLLWIFTKINTEELSPLMAIWLSLASFFGIVIVHESRRMSKRILLFVIFLSGSLTFYGYQATITSKLAVVPKEILPFTNPREILKTNYKVLTTPKNSGTAQVLVNAKDDSVFGQITKFHTDNESFIGFEKGWKMVAYSNQQLTYFGEQHNIKESCFLKSAWRSPQGSPLSFAFTKYSPFRPFFDQAILRLQEKGVFQQINQKWEKYTKYPCEEETTSNSEISLGKIALLLITLVSAIGLSLVILLCEYLTTKMKQNQITGPGLLFRRST